MASLKAVKPAVAKEPTKISTSSTAKAPASKPAPKKAAQKPREPKKASGVKPAAKAN